MKIPPLKVRIIESSSAYEEMFINEGYDVIPYHKDTVPDLVCFTGGSDVNPSLYGEKRLPCSIIDLSRDERDKSAYQQWRRTPKVGICRGGQFLNVMSGGSMWQHVDNHATNYGHQLKNLLHIPSYVEQDELRVSSTHHQMMRVGPRGEVIAFSYEDDADGKIRSKSNVFLSGGETKEKPEYDTEVVWYPETKSLCYQPHPEFGINTPNSKYFFDLINYLYFTERTTKLRLQKGT